MRAGLDTNGMDVHCVMCSIAKVFPSSAKTRQAILTERLMSFWLSGQGMKQRASEGMKQRASEGSRV